MQFDKTKNFRIIQMNKMISLLLDSMRTEPDKRVAELKRYAPYLD